jgi:hypothetical protein
MKSRAVVVCIAISVLFIMSTTAKAIGSHTLLALTATIGPTLSSTPTVTPSIPPTVIPTPTPVPVANVPTTTYEQLLDVHKSVLETTRWAVNAVLAVITVLSCVSGLIISSVTVIGGISGLLAYSRISDAAKRADDSTFTVSKLQAETLNLNKQIVDALAQANEAKIVANQTVTVCSQVQQDLSKSQTDLKTLETGMKSNIQEFRDTLLLVQLEERSIELYSDEAGDQDRAKKALKAMSASGALRHPAFVRRHAVRLLGTYAIDFQDQEIVAWLEKVAKDDPSASIRRTAEHELNKFRASPNSSN